MKASNVNVERVRELRKAIECAEHADLSNADDRQFSTSGYLHFSTTHAKGLLAMLYDKDSKPFEDEKPPMFAMSHYAARNECETAYCIAGFAALQARAATPGLDSVEKPIMTASNEIQWLAQAWLGLSDMCAKALFLPNDLIEDFDLYAVTSEHAAYVLKEIELVCEYAGKGDKLKPAHIIQFWLNAEHHGGEE